VAGHIFDPNRPELRVETFEDLSEAELRRMANECFDRAEGIGQNPGAMAHLLRAQFYLSEIDRRRHAQERDRDEHRHGDERAEDTRIAERDHLMEWIVIILIGFEIVIGIYGIVFGVIEGNKQNKILDAMKTATEATASTSNSQAAKLADLTSEERRSVDSLQKMNGQLQSSIQQTSNMAAAMQKQLKILQDEQAARQAELARKPRLELSVEGVPLMSASGASFKAHEATDTTLVFGITLTNSGSATASRGQVRVIVFSKDVSVTCDAGFRTIFDVDNDQSQHGIIIPFDYIRPGVRIPMSITFNYPAGQQPFQVYFNVDADEIPTATPLGSFIAKPLDKSQGGQTPK